MIFISILIFIFILGILIFAHELSHFIAGRKAKAKIEEFCIGFPPRIYKKKKNGILYSIGIIPWGGFVKFFGDDPRDKRKGSFYQLSIGKRFWIIVAGVLANFLIAMFLYSVIFAIGFPQEITEKTSKEAKNVIVQIGMVAKASPAEKADIRMGDKIVSLSDNKKKIEPKEPEEIVEFIDQNKGKEIKIVLKRGNQEITKKVIPRKNPPKEEGSVGIALIKTGIIEYSWYESIFMGVKTTFVNTKLTIEGLYQVIKNAITGVPMREVPVAGPIGIGAFFIKLTELGFVYIINFTALLSLAFAILNILPFPALDGGRVLFLFIEKIKRKPVEPKVEYWTNAVGFAVLILLMIAITIKDIVYLFR